MKKLMMFFILGFFIVSCANNEKSNSDNTVHETKYYPNKTSWPDIDEYHENAIKIDSVGLSYWYFAYEIGGEDDEKGKYVYNNTVILSGVRTIVIKNINYFPIGDVLLTLEESFPKYGYYGITFFKQITKEGYDSYKEFENRNKND